MKKVEAQVPAPSHGEHQLPAINVQTVASAAAAAAAAAPLINVRPGPVPSTPPSQRTSPSDKGKVGDLIPLERSHSDSSSSKKTKRNKGSDDEEGTEKKRAKKDKKKKKKKDKKRRRKDDSDSQSSGEESESSDSSGGKLEEKKPKKPEKKKPKTPAVYDLSGNPVLEIALFQLFPCRRGCRRE